MVVPIILGIGVTVLAFGTRSFFAAWARYSKLTPEMIASLNNIRLIRERTDQDKEHPHESIHKIISQRYPRTGFREYMTEQEALMILGIEGDEVVKMDKELLKNRYRKLMVVNHPDKNGSQYLSQKINQAKDLLEKSYLFRK